MPQRLAMTLALTVLMGTMATQARAQYGRPYPGTPGALRPAYSPYLNLARPGNAAVNYYGLVRPQIDFNNAIGDIQQDLNTLAQPVDPTGRDLAGFPATGHPVQFMNYTHYYAPTVAYAGRRPRTPFGYRPQYKGTSGSFATTQAGIVGYGQMGGGYNYNMGTGANMPGGINTGGYRR
jgi:hypothetical protein